MVGELAAGERYAPGNPNSTRRGQAADPGPSWWPRQLQLVPSQGGPAGLRAGSPGWVVPGAWIPGHPAGPGGRPQRPGSRPGASPHRRYRGGELPAADAVVRPPAHTVATGARAGHRPAVGTPAESTDERSQSRPARAGPVRPGGVRDGLEGQGARLHRAEVADAIGATRPVDPNGRTEMTAGRRDHARRPRSVDAVQRALTGTRQLDTAALRADVAAQPDQPGVIELPKPACTMLARDHGRPESEEAVEVIDSRQREIDRARRPAPLELEMALEVPRRVLTQSAAFARLHSRPPTGRR
jgi:hypothetical protein